jgi:YegS/Rv2252/BmrU family lipid kinase
MMRGIVSAKRLLLVYNVAAGHGGARRVLGDVETECDRLGFSVQIRCTAGPGHATRLVAEADLRALDGVVACGGDGTVFECVNGLFANSAGPVVPMGVLPLGTGNSFSRDLGLRTGQFREALEFIAGGETRKVDVGHCRTNAGEFHFLNILGVGFVSDVTATAMRLKSFGSAAYTLGVLYRTARLATFPAHIESGDRSGRRDATFIEISNSRYTADFLMAPEAKIDDGLLDVTVLGKISRRRLLRLFPTVFRGEHVRYDEVESFQTRRIRIGSQLPHPLTPDGEIVGTTPFEVECLERALTVFCESS